MLSTRANTKVNSLSDRDTQFSHKRTPEARRLHPERWSCHTRTKQGSVFCLWQFCPTRTPRTLSDVVVSQEWGVQPAGRSQSLVKQDYRKYLLHGIKKDATRLTLLIRANRSRKQFIPEKCFPPRYTQRRLQPSSHRSSCRTWSQTLCQMCGCGGHFNLFCNRSSGIYLGMSIYRL